MPAGVKRVISIKKNSPYLNHASHQPKIIIHLALLGVLSVLAFCRLQAIRQLGAV